MDNCCNNNSNSAATQQAATAKMRASNSTNDCVSLSRVSAEEMDEKRQQQIAYEYLCHLEEAKK